MDFRNALNGIKIMLMSSIFFIVSGAVTLLLLFISVLLVFNLVDHSLMPILAFSILLSLFCLSTTAIVLRTTAFFRISKDEKRYSRIAAFITIFSCIMFIVQSIENAYGNIILNVASSIITTLADIAVDLLFFLTISTIMKKVGRNDIIASGKIIFIAQTITGVLAITRIFFKLNSFSFITTALYIPEFALSIIYMNFIRKIRNVLAEHQDKLLSNSIQAENIQ